MTTEKSEKFAVKTATNSPGRHVFGRELPKNWDASKCRSVYSEVSQAKPSGEKTSWDTSSAVTSPRSKSHCPLFFFPWSHEHRHLGNGETWTGGRGGE
jgi:hypothetical protein